MDSGTFKAKINQVARRRSGANVLPNVMELSLAPADRRTESLLADSGL